MSGGRADVPSPSSAFQNVSCAECGESQVVYSHATSPVTCNSCGNALSEPTGSRARMNGRVSGSAE